MSVEHTPDLWNWQTFDRAPHGQDAYIMPAYNYKRAMACVNACAGISTKVLEALAREPGDPEGFEAPTTIREV